MSSCARLTSRIFAFVVIVAVGIGAIQPLVAASDPTFTKANGDYAAGHFQEAIAGYEQLVATGKWSANLFYNLGNACYRAGDFGKAILHYERALALDPRHPEAEANLRLAREQARALELRPSRYQQYLNFATVTQYTVAACIAFWVASFAFAAAVFARRRSALRAFLLVSAAVIFIVATAAVYLAEAGPRGADVGIVTAKNVEARLATADSAGSVLALPAGSEVKILSTRGDWTYVFLPNDANGWVRANTIEPVRL